MATRSPTQTHAYWGVFPTINLPASANVEVGDTAFDSTLGTLVVCTAVGPVVWAAVGGGGGTIGGTIAANEVAFGTGVDTIGGSASLTYNSGTQDLTVGDGTPHSIRIGPYGYVSNPIIESQQSMNINVVNFGGALGIQAANVDLVLIGGDDGGGESYLQTQAGVRLEVQARATVRPAADNVNALTVRTAADAEVLGVDTTVPAVRLASELQSGGGSGVAGEVLTSNGPGVAPTWQASAPQSIVLDATATGGTATIIGTIYVPAARTLTASSLAYIGGSDAVTDTTTLTLNPAGGGGAVATWTRTGLLGSQALTSGGTIAAAGWYDLTLQGTAGSGVAFARGLYLA